MNKVDYQLFFKRRMVELMNSHTLDSYRVRTNNSLAILRELSYVLRSWVDGNVKRFETVEYCIDECKSLLNNDQFINNDNNIKTVFLEVLNDYVKESKSKKDELIIDKSEKLIFWADEIYNTNDSSYLGVLLNAIRSLVMTDDEFQDEDFMTRFSSFDSLLSSFACELLRRGYSKVFLYKYFKTMSVNRNHLPFEVSFNRMYDKFINPNSNNYKVIIRLEFNTKQAADIATDHLDSLLEIIPEETAGIDKLPNYYRNGIGNIRFFIIDEEALDSHSAAIKANDELQIQLDSQQEHIKDMKLPSQALVLQNVGDDIKLMTERFFILDTGGEFMRFEENRLHQELENIRNNNNIEKDVKDRLMASLRHLRIGDGQTDIDQQFVNYWIALEFIFSSSSKNDNTYQRIKDHLVSILSTCYLKRNLLYIKNWLVKTNLILEGDDIVATINNDGFVNDLENILLKYRMKKLKSHIINRDSIKKYVDLHKSNLLQHLSRIYRLRNELVHEAAIKQDIVNVTSNLRFYLVFVINQMVGFFSDVENDESKKTMLKFFWNYEKHEMLILKSQDRNEKLKSIMNVKIFNSYIV